MDNSRNFIGVLRLAIVFCDAFRVNFGLTYFTTID